MSTRGSATDRAVSAWEGDGSGFECGGERQWQAPAMQCWPEGHTLPQLPQLLSSVFVDTHTPPHSTCVPEHLHAPLVHIAPPLHTVPQAPQLVWLVCRFTHKPLQLVSPWVQPHTPDVHCSDDEHASAHVPQFSSSVCRFTHSPLQLVSPAGHPPTQAPAAQTWPDGHTVAQVPQF
jgi:hypothetical protein